MGSINIVIRIERIIPKAVKDKVAVVNILFPAVQSPSPKCIAIIVELPTAIIIPTANVKLIRGIVTLTPARPKGPTYFPMKIPSTIV